MIAVDSETLLTVWLSDIILSLLVATVSVANVIDAIVVVVVVADTTTATSTTCNVRVNCATEVAYHLSLCVCILFRNVCLFILVQVHTNTLSNTQNKLCV